MTHFRHAAIVAAMLAGASTAERANHSHHP